MMATVKTVCFVSAHLPAPDAQQAGQKMAYHRLKWMAERYRVHLIAFANKAEVETYNPKHYELCEECQIVPVTNAGRLKGVISQWGVPAVVAVRYDKRVEQILYEYYKSDQDVVFWYEYTQMCQYVPKQLNNHKKNIVVCHDVLWQMYDRRAEKSTGIVRCLYGYERNRIKKWEHEVLNKCDTVLAVSGKDKELLQNILGVSNVVVSYPKITAYKFEGDKCAKKQKQILFFGAMNRVENEEAVLWFLDNIWPVLHEKHPDIWFFVVGGNPQDSLLKRCSTEKQVKVTGFVDNPAEYFANALFSVAPLQMGAGVKIKVLECMASSLPVVATAIGAEGIGAEAEDGLIAVDSVSDYRKACLNLLDDMDKCQKLKLAARKWFETHYEPNQETPERIYKIVEQ